MMRSRTIVICGDEQAAHEMQSLLSKRMGRMVFLLETEFRRLAPKKEETAEEVAQRVRLLIFVRNLKGAMQIASAFAEVPLILYDPAGYGLEFVQGTISKCCHYLARRDATPYDLVKVIRRVLRTTRKKKQKEEGGSNGKRSV